MAFVELTNQGHCSGLQALHSIAAACKGFLGPERRVKLVTDDECCEAVFTTEKLLSLLDIEHPVGHLLREACLTQSKRINSGCTTLVCMAGTWANAVQSLLDEGFPAETILLVGDEIINLCVEACKEQSINCSEVVEALQKRRKQSSLVKSVPQTERRKQPNKMVERSQACVMKSPVTKGDGFKTDLATLGYECCFHSSDVVMPSRSDVSYVEDDLSWYFDADPDEDVCKESDSFSPIDKDYTTPTEETEDSGDSMDLPKVSDDADEDVGWFFEECSIDAKYREVAGDTSIDGSPSNKLSTPDLFKVFRNHGDNNVIRTRKVSDGIDLEDSLGDCTSLIERTQTESDEETKTNNFTNEIRDLKNDVDMIQDSSLNNIAPARTFRQSTQNHVQAETAGKRFVASNGLGKNDVTSGISLNTIKDIESQLKTLSINVTPMRHQPTSRDQVFRNSRHFKTSQEHSGYNLEGVAQNGLTNTKNQLGERSEILGQSLSPSRKEIHCDHDSAGCHGDKSFPVSPPPALREILNSSSEVYMPCSLNHRSKSLHFAEPLIKMPSTKGMPASSSAVYDDAVRDNQRLNSPGDSQGGTNCLKVSQRNTAEQNCKHFPQNSLDCESIHHGVDLGYTSSRKFSGLTDDHEEVHTFEKLCKGLSHGAEASMELAKQLCLKHLENSMQCLDPFVCDVVGPSVEVSAVMDGLLLRCEMDQLPLVSTLRSKLLRAVFINGDLTPGFRHPGFKGHMEVKQFTHTLSRGVGSHNSWLDQVTHILHEFKISLVLVKGHVDVKLMDHCLVQDVLMVRSVPYLALEYLSDVTDTPLNVYFSDITQDDVCDNLHVDCWEAGWHSIIRNIQTQRTAFVKITGRSSLQTVVICGPSHPHVEEQLAKFWSSYYKLRDLLRTKIVCLGGAVTELNILKDLEKCKDSLKRPDCSHQNLMKGRIIEAFQEGIEEYIIWLVSNRGDYSKFDVKTAIRNFGTCSCQQREAVQGMFCSDCQNVTSVDHSDVNKKKCRNCEVAIHNCSIRQDSKFVNSFQKDLNAGTKIRSAEVEASFQSVMHCRDGFSHAQGVPKRNMWKNGIDIMRTLAGIRGTGTTCQISETDGINQPNLNEVDSVSHATFADTNWRILPSASDDSNSSKQEYTERPCKTTETGLTKTEDYNSHNGFFCSRALSVTKRSPLNVYEWGTVLDSVTSKTEAWQNGWSLIKLIMSMDCILTTGLKQPQLQRQHNLLL